MDGKSDLRSRNVELRASARKIPETAAVYFTRSQGRSSSKAGRVLSFHRTLLDFGRGSQLRVQQTPQEITLTFTKP